MREGRLGYNSYNGDMDYCHRTYGLIRDFTAESVWKVLVDDQWVKTRMEMNLAREWYLVGTPYCGDLEYVLARIPE